MNRRLSVSLLVLLIMAAGAGGYRFWSGYAARRDWREIRPEHPAAAGADAPGLDARLAGCMAKMENWPPDRQALAEFSQLCHANGFLPEAVQGYRALLVLEPDEVRWPHLLASVLSGLGRLDDALPQLERVTELAPTQMIGWLRLGDARLKLNHTAGAESAYQAGLKRNPGDVFALFGLARCDLQAGRLTAARSRLQQAVAANPDFPGAQSLLAMVFDQLGNTAAADLARKRVTGDGRYSAAAPDPWALDLVAYGHNNYILLTAASAALTDNLPENAVPLLQRALQLAPEDARLHRELGNSLARLGDQAGAASELERALTLAPADEKIRTDLMKILRQTLSVSRLEQVILEGTKTNPDSAGLQFEAGKIALQDGRTDDAIGHFSRAWKLRPEETAAPCELAALYFRSGRPAEGLETLEAVLKNRPNDPEALTLLVMHGIESGDPRTGDWFTRLATRAEPAPNLAALRRSYERRFGSAP